jgi:phosphopantothenoylcysteine decarboxylase/phosphopantothenate--cysteine ligase
MGYAIAEAAKRRGAAVTLVSGPTSLPKPAGVDIAQIVTAAEMFDAVMERAPRNQIVIKAAAVADFAPVNPPGQKIKKGDRDELVLTLKKNPDILTSLASVKPKPFVVAFAAETDSIETNAREKLVSKNADLIVANDVSDPSIGFDSDQNEVVVIARDGSTTRLEKAPKFVIANRILDLVVQRLSG